MLEIYSELNIASWLRMVKCKELDNSNFIELFISYHWEITKSYFDKRHYEFSAFAISRVMQIFFLKGITFSFIYICLLEFLHLCSYFCFLTISVFKSYFYSFITTVLCHHLTFSFGMLFTVLKNTVNRENEIKKFSFIREGKSLLYEWP